MNLDPELTRALAAHPEITNPRAPPEGVSLYEHIRQMSRDRRARIDVKRFYEARLPPRAFPTIPAIQLLSSHHDTDPTNPFSGKVRGQGRVRTGRGRRDTGPLLDSRKPER